MQLVYTGALSLCPFCPPPLWKVEGTYFSWVYGSGAYGLWIL